ncbi:MAG: tetratricopeptide repeat protein [Motiliproteus sp.]
MRWLLHSSMVYTLLALALLGAVSYLETVGLQATERVDLIRIVPDQDEQEEQLQAPPSVTPREELQALLALFAPQPFDLVSASAPFLALTSADRTRVQLMLGRNYYQQKQYPQVVAALAPLDATTRIDAGEQFAYAHALSRLAQTEQAIAAYKALLVAKPNSQSAALNLALLLKKQEDCDRALPHFQHAAAISSGRRRAKALAGAGHCYYVGGAHAEAVAAFSKSIEYRPDAASSWIALGRARYAAGADYADVGEALTRGVSLDAGNYAYHTLKARYQIANLDYRAALASLNDSLQIRRTAQAYQLMGWAYLELGKRNDAKKALYKGLKIAKSQAYKAETEQLLLYLNKKYDRLIAKTKGKKRLSASMQYLKGLAYRRQGRFKKAVTVFQSARVSPLLSWRVKVQGARITRSRQQYPQAVAHYGALLSRNPDADFLHFENALTQESNQQLQAALDEIDQALRLTPDNLVYGLAQARLLFKNGSADAALEALVQLRAKRPNYMRALKLQAEIYRAQQRSEPLMATYEAIMRLDPDDTDTRYRAAQLWIHLGDETRAEQLLTQLLVDYSAHSDGRFLLARLLVQSRQTDQAVDHLTKLIRLNPDHAQARNLLNEVSSVH